VNTKLNLASKPFTNRTLPWLVTALIVFLSLIAFVVIVRSTGKANAETAVLQQEIRVMRQEEEGLRKQADAVKNSLTAEQLLTLKAAHGLVDRKHFLWSRLLVDLESVLPGTVRVTRISVRDVTANGQQTVAELELVVVAKAPDTITNMIADMDRAGVFQAEMRSQNLQKGRGETGTEYELLVLYSPRPGSPVAESQSSSVARSNSPVDGELR
jgi:Tfp pilus assembly protein PilN